MSPVICLCRQETRAVRVEYLEDSSGTHSVKIIEQFQGKWLALIIHFRLPGHTEEAILAMPLYTPQNACREIFRQGSDKLHTPKN